MIIQTSESFDIKIFSIIHHTIRGILFAVFFLNGSSSALFQAYIDTLEKYSFSMGMYLPEFIATNSNSNNRFQYTICRITFRTPSSNLRSDINGLDFYTSSVLGVDRYDIARKLFPVLENKFK